MHVLTARIGEHNAVVVSQKNLARLVQGSERGVRDALKILTEDSWIELRQIGGRGTVNAHIINDRVAWSGKRDSIRYSLFSASVIVSDDEQPDEEQLGELAPCDGCRVSTRQSANYLVVKVSLLHHSRSLEEWSLISRRPHRQARIVIISNSCYGHERVNVRIR